MKKVKLTVGQHVAYVRDDSALVECPEYKPRYPTIGETGIIRGFKSHGEDNLVAAVEWDIGKPYRHDLWNEFPCAPRHGWYVEAGTLEPAFASVDINDFI